MQIKAVLIQSQRISIFLVFSSTFLLGILHFWCSEGDLNVACENVIKIFAFVVSYNAAAPVVNSAEASESSHRVPEFEGGEIENTPQVRDDVVREADRNDAEELPETGKQC